MVTFPPPAPSSEWYARWLNARCRGKSDKEAVAIANRACSLSGKAFSRYMIIAAGKEILLSSAIEGGTARLKKRGDLSEVMLSDHGNWRHVHLGTLDAAYGRTPYFIHLYPLLADIYKSPVDSLAHFNTSLHNAICSFLGIGPDDACTHLYSSGNNSALTGARGMEIRERIVPHISVIDALMKFGRETLLAFNTL